MPGDTGNPSYAFNYDPPSTKDLCGFAAKGNVIIGDYTSARFLTTVSKSLTPKSAGGQTQPYVIDSSDASLGYQTGTDGQGRPQFNGDYTADDGFTRGDGTKRKFYESSLPSAQWKNLIDPTDPLFDPNSSASFNGVFFTNHALAGFIGGKDATINGTMISRDDGLYFRNSLTLNHDIRLLDSSQTKIVALPGGINRPKLAGWKDVSE